MINAVVPQRRPKCDARQTYTIHICAPGTRGLSGCSGTDAALNHGFDHVHHVSDIPFFG
jgi:hypothetical protein